MNLVLLSDTGVVNGGAAKIALGDAKLLAQAGHRVELLCGAGDAPGLKNLPNLTVHRVSDFDIAEDPNRLRAMATGWWNPQAYKRMVELLSGLDPRDTIVHVHSWTKALSSSPIRAAWERGFSIVLTMHDFLVACPTGTLFLQHKQEKCHIKPMSLECMATNCDVASYQHKVWRIGRRAIQGVIGGVPSHIGHFIVYSQMAEDLMRPHLPAKAAVHHVPNVIDISPCEPTAVEENEEFAFLGRITPEKGVVLLARAAAAENVPVRYVGEGPERAAIEQANPQARFSGWLSHREGVETLRKSRALVFPSLWYETLGLVVLEAAGNGVPSIVPDDCAARESVIDGVTGLHFRCGDEADLRRKIAILKDPEVAARMGRAAYERFWNQPQHSAAFHTRRLEEVYLHMMAGHAAEASAASLAVL